MSYLMAEQAKKHFKTYPRGLNLRPFQKRLADGLKETTATHSRKEFQKIIVFIATFTPDAKIMLKLNFV